MNKEVVVTGLGAVTPLGVGARTLYERWRAGASGIVDGVGRCSDFEPTEYLNKKEVRRADRFTQFALVSSDEAFREAGWDEELPYELHVAQLDTQGPTTENLLERAVSTFERNFIIRALEKSSWNVTGTARALGIPLSTLKFKMDKLEIRELARKIRGN